jgi:hypothetical protein
VGTSDESVLSGVLAAVAGLCKPTPGRTPVDLYLLTEPGWFGGLAVSTFRYDVQGHRLIAARSDPCSLAHALAGTGLDARQAWLAVVLVGRAGQAFREHGELAYRLAHVEAGQAALALAAAAARHGLHLSFAAGWDGRLEGRVDLHPEQELVVAVASIHRGGPA